MVRDIPKLIKDIKLYCVENLVADGWMGRFEITGAERDRLAREYPDFKDLIELIPAINKDAINNMVKSILIGFGKADATDADIMKLKTSAVFVNKQLDYIYKQEKDTGLLKDEADKRRKRNSKQATITQEDLDDIKNFMD